jgi:DNA-binding response OmpR family regulator
MVRHANEKQAALAQAGTGPLSEGNLLAKTFSTSNGLQVNQDRRQVLKNGIEIELTKLEFDLLQFLYEHPNLVFSRDRLLEQVWNYDYFGDERVVDVHMARLRKKLEEDPSHPRYIQTIRGVGYKYTP